MTEAVSCKQLCVAPVTKDQAKFINARIRENYNINWLVDGLPAGHVRAGREANTEVYSIGFPLGSDVEARKVPKLHNHYEISIDYHHNEVRDSLRVVGIVVRPVRYVHFMVWFFVVIFVGRSQRAWHACVQDCAQFFTAGQGRVGF